MPFPGAGLPGLGEKPLSGILPELSETHESFCCVS